MNFLKNLLKNKWTYIILAVVFFGWLFFGRGGSNSVFYETAKAQKGDLVRQQSPLNRVATADEIAYTVVFLASSGTDYLTGSVIDMNGASHLR